MLNDITELAPTRKEWEWLSMWADVRCGFVERDDTGSPEWKQHWSVLREWLDISETFCVDIQKLALRGWMVETLAFGSDEHLRARGQIVGFLILRKPGIDVFDEIIFSKPLCLPVP